MNYDSLVIPLAERRMTRFLWKVIHLEEYGWLVPTKHLIAAILMSGKIGFPRVLYEPIAEMVKAGARLQNRIIYENPTYFFTSLYAVDAETFLNPCRVLDASHLLHQYDDRFGDKTLVEAMGFNIQALNQAFQAKVDDDIDLIDKFTADKVEAHLDLQNFPYHLTAVIEAAIREQGFPLVLHPTICEQELKRLNKSMALLTSLEKELEARLPDRVLTFADLLRPDLVGAQTPLRELIQRIKEGEVIERNTATWEDAIVYSCSQIDGVGIPYQIVALGDVKDLPDHPQIPKIHFVHDWTSIQRTLEEDSTVQFHRTISMAKCIDGSLESLQMLFLFSKFLGLNIVSIADMLRAISGFDFASDDIIGGRVSVR